MIEGLAEMDNVNPSILPVRLSYAVAKNKRNLASVKEDITTLLKHSDAYSLFMDEKTKLLEKHAERDEQGKAITNMINSPGGPITNYRIKGGVGPGSVFAGELERLKKKHQTALDERTKQEEAYERFLDEESDFIPHMVTEDLLPDKGIPQRAMDALLFMIKDETDKVKWKR
jgi:DNA-binding transcriptional regulator PaaX